MLKIAAEAAHQAGLRNVTTGVMDAQQLDVDAASFDAAISRLGLMFIPDLPAALAGIRRALKPGGKLAAIVMSSAEKSRYVVLPLEIACRMVAGRLRHSTGSACSRWVVQACSRLR
jgi:ubiquinone/menaquinone biosynthesis C-methylase UbiE